MKKKYLFISGAKRWNNLLNKFTKLQKRLQLLQLLSTNTSLYNKLVTKLQSIFSKLEKMQYQTGIKVAATSLVLILSTFTANAQFATGQLLQAGGTELFLGNYSSPTFADIDGDGDLDLYVGNMQGKIKVFTNTNGVFTPTTDLQVGGTDIDAGYRSRPTFADIDGDGDLDLYVGEYYGGIKVFTNTNGLFTAAADLQAGGTDIDVGYYSVPAFADIDGDGDLDLYVGESYGAIKVFTNTNGLFTATADLQEGGIDISVSYSSSPAFADVDADGDLDLYVGEGNGEIEVFTNTAGVFTATSNLQASGTDIILSNYIAPVFADIDGDGDLDLYVGSADGTIKVFTTDGVGVFTAAGDLQATFSISNIDVGSYATPTFEDIDGDGDLDLHVGGDDGTINVFTNTGGIFTAAADLQASGVDINVNFRIAPAFADVDGDGDMDIVYAGDLEGNMWKFDLSDSDPSNWGSAFKTGNTPKPLYIAKDSSNNEQPITSTPLVTRHPDGGYMVGFGTGKYIELSDISTTDTQTFYGIWDDNATVSNRTSLVEQTVLQVLTSLADDYRITSGHSVDYSSKEGWFMDLPESGERIDINPVIRDQRFVFVTRTPSSAPCVAGGSSWFMEVDYLTGGSLDTSPFDINGDGVINSLDLVDLTYIDENGDTVTKKVYVTGHRDNDGGMIATPTILDKEAADEELRILSNSDGDIEAELGSVDTEYKGRVSWEEIR